MIGDEKIESIFLGPKKVQELLGIGSTKFYEIVRRDDFPKPRLIDGKRPRFLRSELISWAENLPVNENYLNDEE